MTCNDCPSSVSARLLWECQFKLQTCIAMRPREENVAEDALLMMLFVLGFPALTIEKNTNTPSATTGVYELLISPVRGPREIQIKVYCNSKTRQTSLELVPDGSCSNFSRNDCRKDINGRIIGRNAYAECFIKSGRNSKVKRLDACKHLHSISIDFIPDESKKPRLWAGSPPLYPRIAHFELSQLVSKEDAAVERKVEILEKTMFNAFEVSSASSPSKLLRCERLFRGKGK